MEFERENDIMDQRQEMMDDAIDEATGLEGEEEEGEDIVKEVLDEIGVDLSQAVSVPGRDSRVGCMLTLSSYPDSWVKPPQIYRRRPWARRGWRSLWVPGRARVMMTCRRDLTAFAGDDMCLRQFILFPLVSSRPCIFFPSWGLGDWVCINSGINMNSLLTTGFFLHRRMLRK